MISETFIVAYAYRLIRNEFTKNEEDWPYSGEIDVLEGINNQTTVKTALHTSKDCDMFSQVPSYAKTGTWEWSSELFVN